ncbi:suppressor of fused domain protein [Deinococcus yunweiensis]|uniref:suppressor of fused domain protein n=1 Tax=Deinococcus yunweiensis TaxID=367282 RepID=UPI00398EBC85
MSSFDLEAVADHVVAWFGTPEGGGSFEARGRGYTLPHAFFRYQRASSSLIVSVGHSEFVVPGSQQAYQNGNSMRHEFIVHYQDSVSNEAAAVHILELLSSYSRITGQYLGLGSVLPLGTDHFLLVDRHPQFILLMEPLLDDANVYGSLQGQMHTPDATVQFLWAVPIYASEREYISTSGDEAFINRFLERRTDMSDWTRAPVA